jgi:hypothetical protein
MAVDDLFESEVALTAAATAALLSPEVRHVLRRGVVYGLAGAITAGESTAAVARGVGRRVGGVLGRSRSGSPSRATATSTASPRTRRAAAPARAATSRAASSRTSRASTARSRPASSK